MQEECLTVQRVTKKKVLPVGTSGGQRTTEGLISQGEIFQN